MKPNARHSPVMAHIPSTRHPPALEHRPPIELIPWLVPTDDDDDNNGHDTRGPSTDELINTLEPNWPLHWGPHSLFLTILPMTKLLTHVCVRAWPGACSGCSRW